MPDCRSSAIARPWMACVSVGTYLAMSSFRSAKISRSGRMSVDGPDSSRERHFIKSAVSSQPSAFRKFEQPYSDVPYNQEPSAQRLLLRSRHLHPSQPSGKTGFPDLLEHLFHLDILAQQIVDLLHAGPGSAGDALAAATVDHFVMLALMTGHGIDNGFDPVNLLLVHVVSGLL